MAIFKENIDVVNPEGSDADQSRRSDITFYGFLSTDESLNEAFTGISDTNYTDADNTPGTALNDAVFGGKFTEATTPTYTVEIDSQGTPDTFKWSKDNFATTVAATVAITGSAQTLDNGVTITFGTTSGHGLGDQWDMTIVNTTSQSHEMAKISSYHEDTSTDHKSRLLLSVNSDGYPSAPIFTGTGLNDATFGGRYDANNKVIEQQNYYVKIDGTGTPDTFSWSKDNFDTTEATGVQMNGTTQTLDNGVTVTFGATTGHTLNDVWWSRVYEPALMVFSNNLIKLAGDTVLSGGSITSFKVYDANGTLLNTA